MLFILAQVVGVFLLVLYCISMQINKRLTLLFFLMFVNILNALVYCLLGSVAGCFISLISVARLILFTWFDMNNLKCPPYALFFFLTLELFAGLMTYSHWYDILCLAEAMVVTYGTYCKNMTITRLAHLLSCILLFAFNIFVFAYANMLSEAIGFVFTLIGIIRLDLLANTKKRVSNTHTTNL